MKVLVLGAEEASANIGVNVLGRGATEVVKRAFPDASVDVMAFAPVRVNPRGLGGRACAHSALRLNRPLRGFFTNYDLVLDACGGDSFTDQYGLKRFGNIAFLQLTALSAGVRVAMLPQTVGPFSGRIATFLAAKSLGSIDAVMARDAKSALVAEGISGVRPSIFTDLVFALPRPVVEKTRQVIVNVSGLLWNSDRYGSSALYRERVADLVDGIAGTGASITLLPHVLNNPSDDNDVRAIEAVADMYPELEVYTPVGLDDARDVIASAEMVVGARMHACLNAISTGVPAVAWAYSDKFGPLMADLGLTWVTKDLRGRRDPVGQTIELVEKRHDAELQAELLAARQIADARIDSLVSAIRELSSIAVVR